MSNNDFRGRGPVKPFYDSGDGSRKENRMMPDIGIALQNNPPPDRSFYQNAANNALASSPAPNTASNYVSQAYGNSMADTMIAIDRQPSPPASGQSQGSFSSQPASQFSSASSFAPTGPNVFASPFKPGAGSGSVSATSSSSASIPASPSSSSIIISPFARDPASSSGYSTEQSATASTPSPMPGLSYMDRTAAQNVARADNAKSLASFMSFMNVLGACSVGCVLVSAITLGFKGIYPTLTLLICLGSFFFSAYLIKWIMAKDDSNPQMRAISEAIREGAEGFLSVQYGTIMKFALLVSGVLFTIYLYRHNPNQEISQVTMAALTAGSFLLGSFCSALAGYMGVWVGVRVNIRVAVAASNLNYSDSFLLCFRGGAVSSILSASLCILGISMLYLFCHLVFVHFYGLPASHVPMLLAGYGFGASFVALFMQLGGGIYTKAADVGADMVGKVEKNIPEDDPRNPAVVADLVGDNVGDCAGSMADVFESIAAEIIGTMILGATLAEDGQLESAEAYIFFPLIIHGFDLVVSGIGIYLVHAKSDQEDPLTSMKRGYVISMVLAITGFVATCRILLHTNVAPDAWWHFALCGIVGIITSYILVIVTQYYTDYKHAPVLSIAAASQTGHGTNIIAGMAVGLESTGLPILTICTALLLSYSLGRTSGLPSLSAGVYGTAVATMGMLCTAVFVLSMNNFGPIADNAGGIVEMSGQPHNVRVTTDRLDSVGNVTKAASKGFAIGGSALACFVLFQAFMDEVSVFSGAPFTNINLAQVEVVVAGLIGVAMIAVFSGWAIAAVGKTAQQVVWEVRRQFKEKAGIMEGTAKPDYGICVAIVTRAALREMVRPALLALCTPVIMGFLFRSIGEYTNRPMLGIEVVAAFLLFATLTGCLLAIFFDNSGGSWDNAKKYIEANGGKGSDAHKAAVTGDTVGDPFKDTAGPALHVIITTMSTTILVLGPLFIGRPGLSVVDWRQ